MLRRGDQVWWINGVQRRLTGVVAEDQRGAERAVVFCHELGMRLRPRNPKLINPEDDLETAS